MTVMYLKNQDGKINEAHDIALRIAHYPEIITRKGQIEDSGDLKTVYDALTDNDEKEAAHAFANAPIDGLLDRMAALSHSDRAASIQTGDLSEVFTMMQIRQHSSWQTTWRPPQMTAYCIVWRRSRRSYPSPKATLCFPQKVQSSNRQDFSPFI